MAALSPTNTPLRHVLGDLVLRDYDLSGTNGDTLTLPQGESVLQVIATPTTAIALGATRSFNVVTFVTSGAWAGRVTVITRIG